MIKDLAAAEPREMLRGIWQAARGLAIFQGVLADDIGVAFLALLEALAGSPDADGLPRRYGHLFHLLAAEGEFYPDEPVGDAWQNHLLDRLLLDDNPFSRKTQRAGWDSLGPSLRAAARYDLLVLEGLFQLRAGDLCRLVAAGGDALDGHAPVPWDRLQPLIGQTPLHAPAARRLKERLAAAADWGDLLPPLAEHYRASGSGLFARCRAFRWVHEPAGGRLEGIDRPDPVRLATLIGYDGERELLLRNTAHFLAGYPANNVLLYGDRGTGKSSTVKALLNEFGERGLRLIEVPKQHLADFAHLVPLLRDRPERFILFVDDLSFEEHETEFKHLKAILEGSLEARPDNVVLYATSNRRHLIKERFADRLAAANDDEIHAQDTAQEKLSLSDRFGITITFLAPDQETFLSIVAGLAEQRGIGLPNVELRRRALQWATRHNGRSGRTARQFIDYLAAELALFR